MRRRTVDKLTTFPQPTGEIPRLEIPPEIRKALSALALAVNHALEDEQLKVTAYALRDVAPGLIRRACLDLAGTARFWPRPVEIRDAANAIRLADAEAMDRRTYLPPADGERTFRCLKCKDDESGWLVLMRCPDIRCDRTKPHGVHWFTDRCPCWLARHAEKLRLRKQDAIQRNQKIPRECELLDALELGTYRWAKPSELW